MYARSWDPSLIRELGLTWGSVVQRKRVAAAAGLIGMGNSELFGATGHITMTMRQGVYTGELSPFDFIPWVGTFKTGQKALNSCFTW